VSKKDKLIERFRSIPNDFTYSETVVLLRNFGYEEDSNDGSRRSFVHSETKHVIYLHEPHPGSIMKKYQLRDIYQILKEQGYL